MSDSLDRLVGQHDAELDAGRERMDRFEARMDRFEEKLDRALSILSEAKGGWKMLVAVGAIAGALGAFVAKLLPFTGWMPR